MKDACKSASFAIPRYRFGSAERVRQIQEQASGARYGWAEAVMSGLEHHDVPDGGAGALNAAIARAAVRIRHDHADRLAEAGRDEPMLQARRTLQAVDA
jgi:hypothetical protein